MEAGTFVQKCGEFSWYVIVPKIKGGEVLEITNRRWDFAGNVPIFEGDSGDRFAPGAFDSGPLAMGDGGVP